MPLVNAPVRIERKYRTARECQDLMQQVASLAVISGSVAGHPSTGSCIAHALQIVQNYQNPANTPSRNIDFVALMAMPASDFDVPASLSCKDSRYALKIRATPAFFQRLDTFTSDLAKLDFTDVKTVYQNFAIRAALRGAVAISKNICPII